MQRIVLALISSVIVCPAWSAGSGPLQAPSAASSGSRDAATLDQFPPEVRTAATAYIEECRAAEASPSPSERFVVEVELNDDGEPDYIIDTNELNAPCFCGSGGCAIEAWIAESGSYRQAFASNVRGWQISPEGALPTVLIVDLHGTACGGVGVDLCLKALTYRDGKLIDTTAGQ